MISKTIGDYEILREVGEGAMGKVYLAQNVLLPEMQVVLKILKDTRMKERFLAEAGALARLDHKNICQLRHFFHFEGDLVIAMQYIDGQTLADYVENRTSVDLPAAKKLVLQILEGLEYAHSRGVQHRDLKLSNTMVDTSGHVKIIDFGIARHISDARYTATGYAVGTPQYMAPEQFREERQEDYTLCDIYAVGVCLYKLCCGRLPFEETNPFVLADKVRTDYPPDPSKLNPDVFFALEKVINQAMAKRPSDRFQSATEMRVALEKAERGSDPLSAGAAKFSAGHRLPKEASSTIVLLRRSAWKKWPITVAVAIALAIIIWGGWQLVQNRKSSSVERAHITFAISDQTIDEGNSFDPFSLPGCISGADSSTIESWFYSGGRHLKVQIDSIGHVSLSTPNGDWFGAETLWFGATFPNSRRDSANAIFTVRPVNDPPIAQIDSTIIESPVETEPVQLPPPRLDMRTAFDTYYGSPIQFEVTVELGGDEDSLLSFSYHPSNGITSRRISPTKYEVRFDPFPGCPDSHAVMFIAEGRGGKDSNRVRFSIQESKRNIHLTVSPPSHLLVEGRLLTDNPVGEFKENIDFAIHKITLMNQHYPLSDIVLDTSAETFRQTVDLADVYSGTDTVVLKMNVIGGGDLISQDESPIFVNGGSSCNLKEWCEFIAGRYMIQLAPDALLALDSIKFNGDIYSNDISIFKLQTPAEGFRFNTLVFYTH